MANTLVAFDLDGTLIDARHRQVGVAIEAATRICGSELDASRFWRAKRSGATTAAALISVGYSQEVVVELVAEWRSRVESDEWLAQDRSLQGAARVLEALRGAQHRIAVLTARTRRDGAQQSLDASGLAHFVDDLAVVAPETVITSKADVLRHWDPCAFIGDTESDGAAAAAADVRFSAVATGQRSAGYLRNQGYEAAGSLTAAVRLLGLL